MSRVHVARLGVDLKEVRSLLAKEHHPQLRRRLSALEMTLTGATVAQTAKSAGTSKEMIERWLRAVRKGGSCALLEIRSDATRPEQQVPPEEASKLRKQIRAALKDGVNWRLAVRLNAVDRVLAGEKREQVARDAHVIPKTLCKWVSAVRTKGVSATACQTDHRTRPRESDLDSGKLRAWARAEKSPRVAKRLLALAYVAEGLSIDDAAVRVKSSHNALRDWILRFRQGGVNALHDRHLRGSLKQRRELKAFIRRNAAAGHDELCKRVQARFGVRYSPRYIPRPYLGYWAKRAVGKRSDNLNFRPLISIHQDRS